MKIPEPSYTVEATEDGGCAGVRITVDLPSIVKKEDVDVDGSTTTHLFVRAPGYELWLPLEREVDDERMQYRFSSKRSQLTFTATYASTLKRVKL